MKGVMDGFMHAEYAILQMGLVGDAAKACRFYLQFSNRFVGDARVTANTLQSDPYPAREFALNEFKSYCLMASGAQWIADSSGEWGLVNSNGPKAEAAVIELFEYLEIPFNAIESQSFNQRVNPAIIAAFLQAGCFLNMENLKYSAQAKGRDGQAHASGSGEQEPTEPENKDCRKSGDSAYTARSPFNVLKNNVRNFWQRVFGHFSDL